MYIKKERYEGRRRGGSDEGEEEREGKEEGVREEERK